MRPECIPLPPPVPVEPTSRDVPLTISHPGYRRAMFPEFVVLERNKGAGGASNKGGGSSHGKSDDPDALKVAARRALGALRDALGETAPSGDGAGVGGGGGDVEADGEGGGGGGGGRFLKRVRSDDGEVRYWVANEAWAMQKISNDLRRRMEWAKHWLDDDRSAGGDMLSEKLSPPNGTSGSGAENGHPAPTSSPPRDDPDSDGEDPMPNDRDLVVSLKTPKYRETMFARFRKLGEKKEGEVDDYEALKVIGKELFDHFAKDMRAGCKGGGRFFRKARGAWTGEAPFELLDEATALTRITQDLRRRMESANYWLHVASEAPPKVAKAPDMPDETAPQEAPAKLERSHEATSSIAPTAIASKGAGPEPSQPPPPAVQSAKWNLGSYAGRANVRYFRSSIGDRWVEQIVPRRMVKPGGPDSDRYFLAPDGKRFRSMTEVQRFLDEDKTDSQEDYADGSDEDDASGADGSQIDQDATKSEEEEEEREAENAPVIAQQSNEEGGDIAPGDTLNCCKCKKSRCLKLYCECFGKQQHCGAGCNCTRCLNRPQHADDRVRAIAAIKRKNPHAFKPRPPKETVECRCRKTACLKKYCECYVRGLYCGAACECRGCENVDPAALAKREQEDEGTVESQSDGSEEYKEEDVEGEEEDGDLRDDDQAEQDSLTAMGNEGDEEPSEARPKLSFSSSSFAETLHDLITHVDAKDPTVISWTHDGTAFCLHDAGKDKLGAYLQKYFRHNNYSSLMRQLNNYGFARRLAGSFASEFHHPGFHRDIKPTDGLSSISICHSADDGSEGSGHGTKRAAEWEAGGRPRRARIPRVTSSQAGIQMDKRPAAVAPDPVTLTCPHCSREFNFSYARSAKASFKRHVEACGQSVQKANGDQNDPKSTVEKEPMKRKRVRVHGRHKSSLSTRKSKSQGPVGKQKPVAPAKAITYHCAKCSRDFTFYSKKTAAASFHNHERKCDPEKHNARKEKRLNERASQRAMPRRQRRTLSPEKAQPSASLLDTSSSPKLEPKVDDAPKLEALENGSQANQNPSEDGAKAEDGVSSKKQATTSTVRPFVDQPKSPVQVHASKEEQLADQGAIEQKSPKKSKTEAAPSLPVSPLQPPEKPSSDDDIVLSLKNPRYKQVMFETFSNIGKRMNGDENMRLHEMKHELYAKFRQNMGDGGRFLKSDRHMTDMWEVDKIEAMDSE
ncbi:hypothetical protein ACHAWF_014238 [Thalassiosira exigua]